VPCRVRQRRQYADKAAFEAAILQDLRAAEVDQLALAGYMRLVGPTLLGPFAGRIVNVHPSLLPAFPGRHAVREALAYGVKVTGVTVHFVDEGVDTGPIIVQRTTAVHDDDTEETLRTRLQALEHALYPRVLQWLADGRVALDGRRVRTPGA
jgi:phosphoribosylglycinamide formyltransferase-1